MFFLFSLSTETFAWEILNKILINFEYFSFSSLTYNLEISGFIIFIFLGYKFICRDVGVGEREVKIKFYNGNFYSSFHTINNFTE